MYMLIIFIIADIFDVVVNFIVVNYAEIYELVHPWKINTGSWILFQEKPEQPNEKQIKGLMRKGK